MIYVYGVLLVLSLLLLVYCLYSLEINRKLNIKKRQFAIRPSRNKFFVIFCVSVVLVLTFGGLFVHKLLSNYELPVVDHDDDTTGRAVSRTTPLTILSNDVEYNVYSNGKGDRYNKYYYSDGKIYCYDVKTEELTSFEVKSDSFEVVKDDIIVYYETSNDGIQLTHLDFYDKETLKINREIIIDGHLVECFGLSGLFLGGTVNVVVESFNLNDLKNYGYQEIIYSYEEQGEKEEVVKTEKEKIIIDEFLKPNRHNYDRIITHLQFNYLTNSIKTKAMFIADYYITNIDGYLYLFCNLYGKSNYNNESFILKYNPNDLSISDYHTYSNLFYSSPAVYHEGITTYLTFVMYNMIYSNYQLIKIDGSLDVLETKDIYLNTDNRVPGKREKNLIIFNDEIIKVNQTLYYDNNKLVDYVINKEDKTIVINEYLLTKNTINNYCLKVDDSFTSAKIISIKEASEYYFVIYEIDNKLGYVYFSQYEQEDNEEDNEKEELLVNEVIVPVTILSSDLYIIVNDELLTISLDENNEMIVSIKEISKLIKEDLESGE